MRRWLPRRSRNAVITPKLPPTHREVRLDGAPAGFGIASLPEFAARAHVHSGALVPVLQDWEHLTDYAGTAWLLYASNRFLGAKLRVWIDHVVERLPH